jgi:hypothetical protein
MNGKKRVKDYWILFKAREERYQIVGPYGDTVFAFKSRLAAIKRCKQINSVIVWARETDRKNRLEKTI